MIHNIAKKIIGYIVLTIIISGMILAMVWLMNIDENTHEVPMSQLNTSKEFFKDAPDLKDVNITINNNINSLAPRLLVLKYDIEYHGNGMADLYVITHMGTYHWLLGKEDKKINIHREGEITLDVGTSYDYFNKFKYEIYIFMCDTDGNLYQKHILIYDKEKIIANLAYDSVEDYYNYTHKEIINSTI